ncbi:sensor histidine kinase [Blautia sp.]|uniref:sensor histidine kinase n=1 Tax=Blautia sp. TaxID=1955243 RepID=UPI00258DC60F|nr:histidine kinase [Blautia sp.]
MGKLWKNNSLFKKYACIYILLITIPTLVFALFLYFFQSRQLYQQTLHDRKTALQQISENLDTAFLAVADLSNDLTYRNSLVSLVSRSDLSEYPVWTQHYCEEVLINVKYSLKYQNFSLSDAAIFTNNPNLPETDKFYARSRLYNLPFYQNFRTYDKNYDIYYLPEKEAKQYFESKGSDKNTPNGLLLFVRKIQTSYYSGYQGVLILEVNADSFLSSLSSYKGKETGYYMYFKNTKLTYGCTPSDEINFSIKPEENPDILYKESTAYPVIVVSQFPLHKNLYLIPAVKMSLLLIIMSIAQLLVFQLLIKYIFKKINKQITEMDKIIVNEFSGRIAITSSDELSLVGNRYNLLLDKIDTLIDDIVKKETASKNAQIKALQYQINPHFVYNILSIFAGNAEQSGNSTLSEAISYFGHLLRYNIRDTGLYSTVEEELTNTKSLIKVYSLHFRGRLQLHICAEEYLLKQKLMKYLLQPIIENCILYAYPQEYQIDNMQIKIQVNSISRRLIITVTDNGIGIKEKRLQQVNENIHNGTALNHDSKSESSSIGLRNVYRRIKLIYGESANLEIISAETKGTTVTVILPISKEMEIERT